MAGLSTKAIKTRIKSMASTRQITKAMELVASSKLRSAQSRAVACRPYFTALYEAMNEIADSSRSFESPYLRQAGPGKTIYIVIAGDRGLAGGYNNNVLKLAFRQMPQDAVVLPIGKKTVEFFQHRSCEILTEEYREAASVSIGDCYSIAKARRRRVFGQDVSKRRSGLHEFRLAPRADARRAAAAAADDLGGKATNARAQ